MKIKKIKSSNKDKLPNTSKKFKSINKYIENADPEEEWKKLQEWLNFKPKNVKEAIMLLNEQKQKSLEARRLALSAKKEHKRYERSFRDQTEILKSSARNYWEEQKKKGMKKAITNDMIEDYIIANHNTTWNVLNERLEEIKSIRILTEKIADQVDDRAADLRKIIDRLTERDGIPSYIDVRGK